MNAEGCRRDWLGSLQFVLCFRLVDIWHNSSPDQISGHVGHHSFVHFSSHVVFIVPDAVLPLLVFPHLSSEGL